VAQADQQTANADRYTPAALTDFADQAFRAAGMFPEHAGILAANLVDAELDEEERRAPDRSQREKESQVAPVHRATLPVERGSAARLPGPPDAEARLAS